jgi:hypothetical protein
MRNPTHFEIISSRRFFDRHKDAGVSRDNAELIELTCRIRADRRGDPRSIYRGDRQAALTLVVIPGREANPESRDSRVRNCAP